MRIPSSIGKPLEEFAVFTKNYVASFFEGLLAYPGVRVRSSSSGDALGQVNKCLFLLLGGQFIKHFNDF